ncbi:MAG: fibrillarin-like rRNA/tRNA 2'-O-methyltransferase [archaeon]
MNPHHTMKGVFFDKGRIYTKNAIPGMSVYGERVKREHGTEYREWDATRSKLSAAILKKINLDIKEDATILYLGASTGTTVSHLSDMLISGNIYAIEFSPTVLRELVFIAEQRKNIAPLLADANHPENYPPLPKVDIVYMDISQKNQVEIFIKNINRFLKKGGIACLAVKARSIDVTKDPRVIYKDVLQQLQQQGTVVDWKDLDPYEKDHAFFVLRR